MLRLSPVTFACKAHRFVLPSYTHMPIDRSIDDDMDSKDHFLSPTNSLPLMGGGRLQLSFLVSQSEKDAAGLSQRLRRCRRIQQHPTGSCISSIKSELASYIDIVLFESDRISSRSQSIRYSHSHTPRLVFVHLQILGRRFNVAQYRDFHPQQAISGSRIHSCQFRRYIHQGLETMVGQVRNVSHTAQYLWTGSSRESKTVAAARVGRSVEQSH
jgi:hypothetical protein